MRSQTQPEMHEFNTCSHTYLHAYTNSTQILTRTHTVTLTPNCTETLSSGKKAHRSSREGFGLSAITPYLGSWLYQPWPLGFSLPSPLSTHTHTHIVCVPSAPHPHFKAPAGPWSSLRAGGHQAARYRWGCICLLGTGTWRS